jgi:hypothetical protein
MDVQQILTEKLARLPVGEHSVGLKAVGHHIATAIRHFRRGQHESDETAYTDVIYRCNQAFEGSIKEAYRVLASKNPDRVTPAEIETFMTDNHILRPKVLDQFTYYRKEWRNPSTHDYKLDFDEDEALLAVVSVTVFSIVLCDQIQNKLAFLEGQSAAQTAPLVEPLAGSLLDQLAQISKSFAETYKPPKEDTYEHLEGALLGFLSGELSGRNVTIATNVILADGSEIDAIAQTSAEKIGIEVKRIRVGLGRSTYIDSTIQNLDRKIKSANLSGGLAILIHSSARDYQISPPKPPFDSAIIKVVSPATRKQSGDPV